VRDGEPRLGASTWGGAIGPRGAGGGGMRGGK